MKHTRSLWFGTLVGACLFAACGGGGGGGDPTGPATPGTPGGPSAPSPSAQVSMSSGSDGYGGESHAFQPTRVEINRNGTVTWVNGSGVSHNVTFSTNGAPANIGDHSNGSTSRTFPTAGTFEYSCTNHQGMTGRVVVQ